MLCAIIFDFDGVILESANIKTKAFEDIVANYPSELANAFIKYHMDNMGVSRYVKFKYLIEDILGQGYNADKIEALADEFSKNVFQKVMKCDFVLGAEDFLEHYHNKFDLFIASGTPENEIKTITQGRGISKYFKGVFGTPKTKVEIIESILQKYRYKKNEVVFVGDADTDRKSAEMCGIKFIGRITSDNERLFRGNRYLINDLRELAKLCITIA